MIKIIFLFVAFFFLSSLSLAQTDWIKWDKAEESYQIKSEYGRNYKWNRTSISSTVLSGAQSLYYFFISDLDGKNCPFHPSCSVFFIESSMRTNVFKAALMFADRFVRDTNLFKRYPHYPKHASGSLYDPVENYLLNQALVKYFPREEIVE